MALQDFPAHRVDGHGTNQRNPDVGQAPQARRRLFSRCPARCANAARRSIGPPTVNTMKGKYPIKYSALTCAGYLTKSTAKAKAPAGPMVPAGS